MNRLVHILLIFLLVVPLAGCEEDVVAVLNAEYPYSMYGVLNPLADVQYIRVFKVEGTLVPEDAGPLDVQFLSQDLELGQERVWRDSLIAISDGTSGHVFYSEFRPEWEHAYRISIVGQDGQETVAEVKIPPRTNLILEPPDTTRGVILPAFIEGRAPQLFKSKIEIQVKYVVGFDPAGNALFDFLTYSIPFDDRMRRVGEDGWSTFLDMNEAYAEVAGEVLKDLRYQASRGIALQLITFSTVIGNEEWAPPDGVFDPNVLIQPGAFSNVENGFGLVVAGYRLERAWTLPVEVVELTSFVPNV